MKVTMFAGGLKATLTARTLPLAEALEDYGVECKLIAPIRWPSVVKGKLGNVLSVALTHLPKKYIETLQKPPDFAIIGRVSTPQMYLLQKLLRSKGTKVIFDLDDALFLPSRVFGINFRSGSFCLEGIIKNADFVTVNGNYLLEYVKVFNKNATVIPDPVDDKFFSSKSGKDCDKITIGWEGNPKAHYGNLVMLVKPLGMLARKYDIRFKLVSYLGDVKVKQMFGKLECVAEVDYGLNRWVSLDEYAKLLSDFDILVAPLIKTPWYEGKSSLRVGIGMAMGIPVVASPVGEQKYVIKHGINGFLAKNEEEWYKYLKMLIEDEKLRDSMGKSGRETAEKKLSSSACGKKLFDIMNRLLQ